jgi:hypothetical protein
MEIRLSVIYGIINSLWVTFNTFAVEKNNQNFSAGLVRITTF